MKLFDRLFGRPAPAVAPVAIAPTPIVTPVSKDDLDSVSQRLDSVRDELIAVVNAVRTKAEMGRNEAAQARLEIAKLRVEVLRLKGDIESLRTSSPDADCLASIGRLLDSQAMVVSSRKGNVISDLRTKEFGNVVRL